jgi:hypothetical protein
VLAVPGGERRPLGTYALEPGETMIVLARTVGGRLYAYPLGGVEIRGVPPEREGESVSAMATPNGDATTEALDEEPR